MEFITRIHLPDFPSLALIKLDLNSTYFPISPLANILGYSTPYSLIQNIPPELKISVSELYSLYTIYLDQFCSYTPMSEHTFKKNLSVFKPLWFTDIEGINYILSKNTFTIPRLKQSIAQVLGLSLVAPPRKESVFYSTLQNFLDQHNITLQRHLYLAGYFIDCAIEKYKIAIEYDEDNHKSYDCEKELKRENILKQLGYSFIRVDDSIPPEKSALQVYLTLINIKQIL